MRSERLAIAACALLLLAPLAASAQEILAPPLPLSRSLYVLDVPFLHFGALDLTPLEAGRVSVDVDAAYANTFSHTWHAATIQREFHLQGQPFTRDIADTLHVRHPQDVIAFLDAELTRVALVARAGLTRSLAVEVEVPWISWSALHADGAIEDFHRALGIADAQRPLFPRGRFQLVRQRPFGALEFDDATPSAGLGDATLRLAWRGMPSDRTEAGVAVAVKAPTGSADDLRGSGSWDAGVIAGVSRRFFASRRLGLHLQGAVVEPGRYRGERATTIRETGAFTRLVLGADVRIGRGTYVSLTGVREQSPFRRDDVGDGARASIEVVFGIVQELSRHARVRFGVTENVPQGGDAADVAVLLGLSVR